MNNPCPSNDSCNFLCVEWASSVDLQSPPPVNCKSVAYPEYVVPKSNPTINRSFSGAGSRIGPDIASVELGGV